MAATGAARGRGSTDVDDRERLGHDRRHQAGRRRGIYFLVVLFQVEREELLN
jgi:hypothetical protein